MQASRSGVAVGRESSPPLLSRAPRGRLGEKRRCELFLVASSMTPFKPSGFTSEGVCRADGCGSGGRVGPGAGVEEWEGGLGFNPGLWRSCPLRMSWRP